MQKKIVTLDNITSAQKATYAEMQKLSKRGLDTWKIQLDKIVIKDGWNDRHDFGDIDELAEGILANSGTDPISVDVLKDGTAVVTDGERRYMAYLKLNEPDHAGRLSLEKEGRDLEWLTWMPAFINAKDMTTADRMIKKITTNNGKPFEPYEEAMAFKKLVEEGMKPAEIAKRTGKNRMIVSLRLAYSNITSIEKKLVDDKLISATEWVKLYKAMPDDVQRVNALLDATKGNAVVDNAGDILAGYVIKKDFTAEHDKAEANINDDIVKVTGQEPLVNFVPETEIKDPITGIESFRNLPKTGSTTPPVPDNTSGAATSGWTSPDQAEAEPDRTGWTEKEPGVWVKDKGEYDTPPVKPTLADLLDKPKTGLAALLDNSTAAPSNEPDPVLKTRGFTAGDILNKGNPKTEPTGEGFELPENGTVKETLRDTIVLLRSLERYFKGDHKMAEISAQIDRKIRYLQNIASNSMLGMLTGTGALKKESELENS